MHITPLIANATDPRTRSVPLSHRRAQQVPHAIFFEITIVDEADAPTNRFARTWHSRTLGSLRAGHTYLIRASTTACPSIEQEQKSLVASKTYSFAVGCPHSQEYGLLLSESEFTVDALELEMHFECKLQVSEECPCGEIDLLLLVTDEMQFEDQAARVRLYVNGTYHKRDTTFENRTQINLATENAEHSIIMHVYPAGNDAFQVIGWAYRDRPRRQREAIKNPHIELATFVEEHLKPEDIHGRMREWAASNPGGVLSWLHSLYRLSEAVLDLIINDETEYEIPWEMIEFDSMDEVIAVGAAMRVTRWVRIERGYAPYRLDLQSETIEGQVLAHIDSASLKQAEEDAHALAPFSVTEKEDLKSFLNALAALDLWNAGLLYLGCHGVFSVSTKHRNLLNHAITNQVLAVAPSIQSISHLNLYGLPPIEGDRPVFFVNACHSARILHEGDGINTRRIPLGFPIVALQRIARGYIGTTGPVGDKYAGSIAQKILSGVASGLSISEALRLVRAEAFQDFVDVAKSSDDQAAKNYIYTFMYVFFGNPMTYLKLKSNPTSGGLINE